MDTFQEELNEAANALEKDIILQKYGVIEPKLTPAERYEIAFEQESPDYD